MDNHHSRPLTSSLIVNPEIRQRRRRYKALEHGININEQSAAMANSTRFISMSILTSTMMIAEIITAVATGSLTLMSDALHMFSDLMALIIGFIANQMANGNSKQNSFEHSMVFMRYEIVGALINGTVLLTSCFLMATEAFKRILIVHEEIENVDFVLIVGGLGLIINLLGLCIFGHHGHHSHQNHSDPHSHSPDDHLHTHHDESEQVQQLSMKFNVNSHSDDHKDENPQNHNRNHNDDDTASPTLEMEPTDRNLNMHGVFLHILGDLLGSVAVMISALTIKFTSGWWNMYIDPVCTLFIVILISRTAWPLVKRSANILLDKSPFQQNIIEEIQQELKQISGVLNVHELHCWEVKNGYYMATVHLIIDPNWNDHGHTDKYCYNENNENECDTLHDKMTITDEAKAILHKYGIHSSIVQSEFPKRGDSNWEKAIDPCFDYVCDTSDCIKKSMALSNAANNVKKQKGLIDNVEEELEMEEQETMAENGRVK